MSKISQTLSLAGGHLGRPTRFSVLIAPPASVVGPVNSRIFDTLCKSIKIPDITMEPIDIKYKGHNLKIPGRVNQEQTIEMTFYLDENHNLRQVLSDWLSGMDKRYYAINTPEAAALWENRNIFGGVLIKARDFDETNREPMNYLVKGLYPISLSGPEWGSANVGEVQEFTVTFAYYKFLSKNDVSRYEFIDDSMDALGQVAGSNGGVPNFGSFTQFSSILNQASGAINTIGRIWDSVSNIF